MLVPCDETEITADWLRAVIPWWPAGPVRGPERIGGEFGLASTIHRVSHGDRSVVVKLWPTGSVAGTREVRFFQTFAPGTGPRVPAGYYSGIDDERGRAVLVLEDLRDARQGDCLTRLAAPAACRLARSLAALHANWWRSEHVASAEWLLEVPARPRDRAWYAVRKERLLDRFGDRFDRLVRDLIDAAPDVAAQARAALAGAAPTLLHRDLHLDNVLFLDGSDEPVLLDWAMAARGPAVHDLVKLVVTIGELTDADAVVDSYVGELRRRGVPEPDVADVPGQFGHALVLYAIDETYGKARWEPATPREQRIIDVELDRVVRAVHWWQERAPRG